VKEDIYVGTLTAVTLLAHPSVFSLVRSNA